MGYRKLLRLLDKAVGLCKLVASTMNNELLIELIDESIALELNVASIYKFFSESITHDSDFWWQLHLEEKSHATLLRSGKESFIKRGRFPRDIVADSIRDLKEANENAAAMLGQFDGARPGRREACKAAIELEQQAGESHFMKFMEKDAESALESVFQQLNRSDKGHERRIKEHLASLPADA
ncbi:rubrerythrin family protein [Pontiella sulfatireligans]|uniref:Rubrerythrin diiron-binding domain-containing protein n=1 Tax=Pontiella sulfatireligans TaxID=2750658 RepID=A0A6C2UI20_9BACT|nr:rubrerythrin family protein [Pontiella sulfatireligans]VGO19845.1 hypothetical protein SCARR_01905 [Pontiella sulfatireligans]